MRQTLTDALKIGHRTVAVHGLCMGCAWVVRPKIGVNELEVVRAG